MAQLLVVYLVLKVLEGGVLRCRALRCRSPADEDPFTPSPQARLRRSAV